MPYWCLATFWNTVLFLFNLSKQTEHQKWTENSSVDPREINQMKSMLLSLNAFNMWMTDRAWILKFTKRMGLGYSEGYLASPCFRFLC